MRLTATARGKALAQATAESRCCKTAAASAELDLAKVQRLKDAFAKETCRRAALVDVKRHEDALAAEEHQRAALAAAEQEASKFAAIMALLRADMAELARAVEALTLVKERRHHGKVLAVEADDRCCHEAATWAAEALTLVKELCRLEAVLAAEADDQRRHEAATRTAESEALTLVKECLRHKAATWASLSTLNHLVDKQSCQEAAARATASAQPVPAVRPRTRPRRRTGRRNIPRAPSFSVEVPPPTHPNLVQPGGLPTPTSTMLERATSPCRSVVSSPTPASTTPHTPSLHPFTFDDGILLSSGGGNAHPL